jgi:hypothetical protein
MTSSSKYAGRKIPESEWLDCRRYVLEVIASMLAANVGGDVTPEMLRTVLATLAKELRAPEAAGEVLGIMSPTILQELVGRGLLEEFKPGEFRPPRRRP